MEKPNFTIPETPSLHELEATHRAQRVAKIQERDKAYFQHQRQLKKPWFSYAVFVLCLVAVVLYGYAALTR